jgi:hypothetical protein
MTPKQKLLNEIVRDFERFNDATVGLQVSVERAAREYPGDADIVPFVRVVRDISKATIGIVLTSLSGGKQ